MRLLILHQAGAFGGAERTTANLIEHLDRGLVSHLALAAPTSLRAFMPAAIDQFIATDGLIQCGWFESPRQLMRDAREAAAILRQARPDVVLGMMHYSAALIALACRLDPSRDRSRSGRRPRIVGSFRGPATEYISRYEHGWRRRLFLRLAITGAARLSDRLIVPSRGTADDARRHFLAPASRLRVVPNGIDSAAVTSAAAAPTPELAHLPPDLPLLCVAARLSIEKDLDILIQALGMVQAAAPCALAIVGDGPQRDALQQQVSALGLSDRVVFVGQRDNVFPYIRRADIYVHTCQFEGFGYTMLEALACGTPVIATDCPSGPREVLADGRYGQLVQPGNATALAEAISALLADAPRRQHLATAGHARAAELSVRHMVDAYQAVFAELREP